jgi:hypothetical protein
VSGDEASRWLCDAPVDRSIFRPAQPIYTAGPVIASGAVDPMPKRLVTLSGAEVVEAPAPEALALPARQTAASRRFSSVASLTTFEGRQCVDRMIANALLRVRTAAHGDKHRTLRAAAVTIGGLIDAAGISGADAHRQLLDAVTAAGALDLKKAAKTAEWGLSRGRERPLTLGLR